MVNPYDDPDVLNASDEARIVDMEWFENHPDETEYVRLPLKNEWKGMPTVHPETGQVFTQANSPGYQLFVRVTKIAPGVRTRVHFYKQIGSAH